MGPAASRSRRGRKGSARRVSTSSPRPPRLSPYAKTRARTTTRQATPPRSATQATARPASPAAYIRTAASTMSRGPKQRGATTRARPARASMAPRSTARAATSMRHRRTTPRISVTYRRIRQRSSSSTRSSASSRPLTLLRARATRMPPVAMANAAAIWRAAPGPTRRSAAEARAASTLMSTATVRGRSLATTVTGPPLGTRSAPRPGRTMAASAGRVATAMTVSVERARSSVA